MISVDYIMNTLEHFKFGLSFFCTPCIDPILELSIVEHESTSPRDSLTANSWLDLMQFDKFLVNSDMFLCG